jgi:hypothetical protein
VTEAALGTDAEVPRIRIACDMKGKISATPSFEGRGDILLKMRECFNSTVTSIELGCQRRFVLHGLGGAGKTQLMYKFIQDSAGQ